MKRSKKVYGVYNIVEWYANIRAGKATVKVLFSGGAMTTQGVTPATFTTNDPIVQLAIEHSEPYRNGKIKLIKAYPTNEDVAVERNRHKENGPIMEPTPTTTQASGQVEEKGMDGVGSADISTDDSAEVVQEIEQTEWAKGNATNTIVKVTCDSDATNTIVKVTCDRDAAEYMREKYGIALSKLRSKAAIAAAAEQYGVRFEIAGEIAGKD